MVPFDRDEFFVGRQEILDNIRHHISFNTEIICNSYGNKGMLSTNVLREATDHYEMTFLEMLHYPDLPHPVQIEGALDKASLSWWLSEVRNAST